MENSRVPSLKDKKTWEAIKVSRRGTSVGRYDGYTRLGESIATLRSAEVKILLLITEMCLLLREGKAGRVAETSAKTQLMSLATGVQILSEKEMDRILFTEDRPDPLVVADPTQWMTDLRWVAQGVGKGTVAARRRALAMVHDRCTVFRHMKGL